VQLVQYLGSLSAQVKTQFVIAIKSTQYVLLDVADNVCLAEVVQCNLAKAGEQPSDRAALTPSSAD